MSEKKKQTLDSPWKQKNMPYITSAERIGREKGKQEGRYLLEAAVSKL